MRSGRIDLKDNETLYLAGGAVVRGVIRARNVSGARILGPGILDASTRDKQTKMVELNNCTNIEINGVIVLGSYGWTIVPRLSENIRLRNVKSSQLAGQRRRLRSGQFAARDRGQLFLSHQGRLHLRQGPRQHGHRR